MSELNENKLQERFEQTNVARKLVVTEEMVLLVIKKRHEWLKEYVNSDWEKVYFISDAEEYINNIKFLVDDMHSLLEAYLEAYKKEEASEEASEE